MIYVTGDTHSDVNRLSNRHFPEAKNLTKDDFVVICGDFGLIWEYKGESGEENHWLWWLESRPFTTLSVDGNNENFDRLNAYPVEEWNGGKIHRIRPSVIHLMRGQVYDLPFGDSTKRIFAFGGAKTRDARDGILDPVKHAVRIKEWRHHNRYEGDPYKYFRVIGQSWWEQEMPSREEMDEGIANLDRVGWKVDYVFTHDCSRISKKELNFVKHGDMDGLNDYLDGIQERLTYDRWFFGHHHDNQWLSDHDCMLYEDIIPVDKHIDEELLQLWTT